MNCKAIRVNDEMHCGACGLQWDHDDPEPPACRTVCPGPGECRDAGCPAHYADDPLAEARRALDDE